MKALTVRIKILSQNGSEPSYAHPGDSGMDLRAGESFQLAPFERKIIPCGFSIEIPIGYGGFVLPRSGLASKKGVTVANAPGLIDSGYRGEVCVALVNLDNEHTYVFEKGERIAQLVIMPTPIVQLEAAETLSDTSRGEGGFGSSGTN